MDYYVEIYQPNGTTRVGSGPVNTVISWQQTFRLSRAGEFSFRMLAEDEQAGGIVPLNTVRFFAIVRGGDGDRAEYFRYIGGGIIQNISTDIGDGGKVILTVGGQDWLGELSWVSMDRRYFNGGTTDPGIAVDATTAITGALSQMASPQSSWTATVSVSSGYNTLYGRWSYENVLQAIIKLAELTNSSFVLSSFPSYSGTDFRNIKFQDGFRNTNIRAVQIDGNSDVAPDTVIIKNVSVAQSRQNFVTRVIPFGAGNGDSKITMLPSTLTPSAGYAIVTSNPAGQYKGIRNTSNETTYGVHTHVVEWPEIAPESNSTTALEKAADQLFYLADAYLRKNETVIKHYDVELAKSLITVQVGSTAVYDLLQPLHTIRVQYSDSEQSIDIDESLNIIEATHLFDADGLQTTRLLVGNVAEYPVTDTEATVERLSNAEAFAVASQIMPNTHALTFSKPIGRDQTPVTTLRFRLGSDIVQVFSVVFDFFIGEMVSTIDAVTATSNTVSAHTHTIPDHDHNTESHSHVETGTVTGSALVNVLDKTNLSTNSAGSHSHTITPAITYDVYQSGSSYALSALEYRLNAAASWTSMDTSSSTTGSWYRFDLTTNIRNSTTLRPNQADNLIEVRRKSASTENTAQLEVQITIQSTVQTIV
jgi:hypothetical protein